MPTIEVTQEQYNDFLTGKPIAKPKPTEALFIYADGPEKQSIGLTVRANADGGCAGKIIVAPSSPSWQERLGETIYVPRARDCGSEGDAWIRVEIA